MTNDSTLRTLFKLHPTLQTKIQDAQARLPQAVLQSRGTLGEIDCTAVLRYETNLTAEEAEALRISKELPEVYPDPLVVCIMHQPTLVFARVGEAISIELTTSLSDHRKSLDQGNSLPVSILQMVPGDEEAKRTWHQRFQNQHLHGTWFHASSKLVKAIQDLAA